MDLLARVFAGTWHHFCRESFTTPEDPVYLAAFISQGLARCHTQTSIICLFFLISFLSFLTLFLLASVARRTDCTSREASRVARSSISHSRRERL